MKKILSVLMSMLLLVGIFSTFVGCKKVEEEPTSKTIVDTAGVSVEIPKEVNRVVCTSQNAMEFMVAMGLQEKLVGVHRSVFTHAWTPEYMKDTSNIKGFGYTPSAEALYELETDLVIVKTATAAEELRTAGITAITFEYSNREEMFYAVRMLGDIFGEESKAFAERWIKYYEDTVKTLETKLSGLSNDERVSAYFIDASGALDAGGLTTTAGGDSIIAEWFASAGMTLVTKDYTGISSINEEEILEINPEVIWIGGWCENARKEQLMADPKWVDIDAVKNNEIYLAPVGFVSFERYAVEAPILLMYTASVAYPDYVEYDANAEFSKFFQDFFGITVSNEKIEYMLNGLSPSGERMD